MLCLYHPREKSWHNELLLSEVIVPWISEWLLFYEIWSITGEWKGGGSHP
jgi:hypothetical protein